MSSKFVIGILAIVLCSTGCWREVEYTPPASTADVGKESPSMADQVANAPPTPVSPPEPETTDESKSAAGEFGEDLAKSLSPDEHAEKATEPAETTPITESTPPPASVVGDRYATKTPEVATPATTSDSATTPAPTDDFESLFKEPVDPNDPPNSPVKSSMPIEEREAIAEESNKPVPNVDVDDFKNPPAVQNWSTRRAAWLLGSKLSLAALANERGAPSADVQKLFDQSRSLGKKMGITVKDLPPRPAAGAARPASPSALDYLFTEGQEIGGAISRQGEDHAALFEVAVKSNILLVLYKPGSPTTQAIAAALKKAGERAKLPATLWQPLLDTLAANSSLADVQKSVYELHDATDKFLDEAAP